MFRVCKVFVLWVFIRGKYDKIEEVKYGFGFFVRIVYEIVKVSVNMKIKIISFFVVLVEIFFLFELLII